MMALMAVLGLTHSQLTHQLQEQEFQVITQAGAVEVRVVVPKLVVLGVQAVVAQVAMQVLLVLMQLQTLAVAAAVAVKVPQAVMVDQV